MFEFKVSRLDKLKIDENRVATILTGIGTHLSYTGKLRCSDIVITVQGEFPGSPRLDNVMLHVNDGAELLDNSIIGKTFRND